jgi:hypothetical protein
MNLWCNVSQMLFGVSTFERCDGGFLLHRTTSKQTTFGNGIWWNTEGQVKDSDAKRRYKNSEEIEAAARQYE